MYLHNDGESVRIRAWLFGSTVEQRAAYIVCGFIQAFGKEQ